MKLLVFWTEHDRPASVTVPKARVMRGAGMCSETGHERGLRPQRPAHPTPPKSLQEFVRGVTCHETLCVAFLPFDPYNELKKKNQYWRRNRCGERERTGDGRRRGGERVK